MTLEIKTQTYELRWELCNFLLLKKRWRPSYILYTPHYVREGPNRLLAHISEVHRWERVVLAEELQMYKENRL